MVNIPLFTRFYTSQVVQDFFHPQYDSVSKSNFCNNPPTDRWTLGHSFRESVVSQFFSRSAQAVFLLMEYCSGGDLFSQGSSNVGDNGEGHAT